MSRKLAEIFEDMRLALLGRKEDHSWSNSASEAYAASMQGIKGFSNDTLSKTTESLNEALPFITRAGFDVIEIEIGLGLSPNAIAHLYVREHLSDANQQILLDEVRNKKLVSTILNSLFKAASTHKKMKFKNFDFTHMELELSILPSVALKFRPSKNIPEDKISVDQIPDIIDQ